MAVTEKTHSEKNHPDAASANYVDFDEFIDYQLRKTRSGIHQTDLIAAGVVLLSLFCAYVLIFALLDQWIIPNGLSSSARLTLLTVVVLAACGWVGWKIVFPWLQSINELYAARQIEEAHPELKGSLLTWVNFRQTGREVSPAILAALEKRTAHEISHVNMDETVDRRILMRTSYVLLGLVVATCLYTLISPKKMSTTLWRALLPTSAVSAATRTEIRDVKPGNTEVLARDQLDVIAELGGQIPPEVTLRFSTADRRFVNEPIRMQKTQDELPRFQARLTGDGGKGLLSDVTYHIEAGDARSAAFQVRVNQPPSADVTEIAYEYPRYMGLRPSTQTGTTIEAWEGTFVTVRARPNMPIKKAAIYCSDLQTAGESAEEYPMTIQDDLLTARWQLKFRDDGTFARYYHIQVWNERGQKNPTPTIYRLQIRPDLKPELSLISPTKDLSAPANSQVPVALSARDPDFLLRRVSLKLQQNGELLPFPAPLFAAPPEMAEFKTIYRLQLSEMPLKAGDQLTLWIEAEDNFEPFGKRVKNVSRSPQVTITITDPVPPAELKKEQQKQAEQLQENIQQAAPNDQPERPQPPGEQRPENEQPQDRNPQDQPQEKMIPPEKNPNAPMQEAPGQQPPAQQPQQEENGQQGEAQPGQKGGAQQSQTQPGSSDGPPQDSAAGQDASQQQPADGNGQDQKSPQMSGKNSPQENGGETGTEPGTQNQQSPQNSAQPQPRKDKAAEDQAIDKLLKWNQEQQEKSEQSPEQKPGETPDQPNSANNSQQQPNGDQSNPAKQPNSEETQNQNSDDSMKNGSASEPVRKPSDPAGQNEANQKNTDPKNTDQKNGDQQGSDQKGGDQKNGDQPSTGASQGTESEKQNGTSAEENSASPEQMKSPSEGNSSSDPQKQKPTGENAGESPATGPDPRQKNQENSKPNDMGPSAGEAGKNENPPGMKGGAETASPAESETKSPAGDNQNSPQRGGDQTKSTSASGEKGPQETQGEKSSSAEKPASEMKQDPSQSTQDSSKPDANGTADQQNSQPPAPNTTGQPGEEPQPGQKPGQNDQNAPKPSGTEKNPTEKTGSEETDIGKAGQEKNGQEKSGSEKMNQEKTGQEKKTGTDGQTNQNAPQERPTDGSMNQNSKNPGQPPQPGENPANDTENATPTDQQNSSNKPDPTGQPQNGEKRPDGSSPKNPQEAPGQEQMKPDSTPPKEGTGKEGTGKEGTGKEGAGKEGAGKEGTGKEGTGKEGTGKEGTGKEGTGKEGTGKEGTGKEGTGKEGTGKEGTGKEGTGKEGTGKEGTGKEGTGKEGTGKEGTGKEGTGKEGTGKEGTGKEGTGKEGGQQGRGDGRAPGGGGGAMDQADHSGKTGNAAGSSDQLTPEQADLQNKKKATELALKRLRNQLERGETPQELMNELGYTEQDLERFMHRLQERLADPGLDRSPESEAARRQFDSILKGIDYGSSGEMRSGGERERKASQSSGSGNRLAPPQYRRDSEAYKERLSRPGSGG